MPGGDRTGPIGAGPMTGRGVGYCAGYPVPGYANPIGGRGCFGRGRGFGRGQGGFGRGRRHWHWPVPGWMPYDYGNPYYGAAAFPYNSYSRELTASEEMNMLKEQSKILEAELRSIKEAIGTLEKAQVQEEK